MRVGTPARSTLARLLPSSICQRCSFLSAPIVVTSLSPSFETDASDSFAVRRIGRDQLGVFDHKHLGRFVSTGRSQTFAIGAPGQIVYDVRMAGNAAHQVQIACVVPAQGSIAIAGRDQRATRLETHDLNDIVGSSKTLGDLPRFQSNQSNFADVTW